MAESVDRVIKVISSPIEARDETEMGAVIPWLRRTSQLLKGLEKPVLYDILRNCDYQRCQKDDVIIRQGDIGEIDFYIILRGTVSVYIDSQMSGEDSIAAVGATPPSIDKRGKKKRAAIKPASPVKKISGANRAKFGKFIVKFEPGKSFGEIALLTKGSIRNASIVVDEETDFLVVHRSLFNRCLKVHEEREFAAIRDFVDTHPFFANWQRRLKRFLEMSVRKEVFEYNSVIAKQGDPVTALYFIYHGQADIIVDPSRHKKQFRRLWPFEAVTDLYAQEFEWLRESRKEAIARKYGNDPAILQTRSDNLTVRRTEGYAAAERLIHGKTVTLCSVTDMEVIGDTEVVSNLETYMQSVVCSAATQVYILDMKNYERLIMKKNPATLEVIKDIVSDKLLNRMSTLQGKQVPLMKYLHFKLHEENFQRAKELPPLKTTKHLPDNELLQKYLVKSFIEGKSQICEPHVPGMTYFQNLMQDKARIRENIRINQGIKRNREKLYSDKMKNRQPRSSTALKEALELMEEEDMIAWREHMGKDFLEMIVPPTKMLTEPSATAPKPLSSWRVQRRLKRPEKITFGDTPHSNEKQGTEVNNGTVLEAANEDLCDAQVSKPIGTESPLEVGVNGDANSQGEAVRSEQKISVQATNSDQYSDNLEQTDESASIDRKSSSSEMPSEQTLQIIPEKSSVPSDSTNIEPDQPTEDREAQQGDGNLGNQKLDLAPLMSDSEADIAKPNTSETELIASMELEEETESRDLEHVSDTIPNDADVKSKVDVDDSDVIKPAQNRVVSSKPVMITHLTAIREESFIHSEPAKQPSSKKPKKKKTTTLTKDSNTCSYVVIHEDTPTKEQSKSIFHALYGGDESQQDEETEPSEDGDSKLQDSETDEAEKIQHLADQLEKGNDETNGDAESVPQRKRKRTQKQEVSHVNDETEQSVSTRAWGLTRQFVQQKIEKKKQQSTLYDDRYSEYKDYETSDRTLNFLENRLRAFHLKYSNSRRPIKLPKLRRFKYNQDELYRRLRQGGRVRIMRRKCDLAQSDYKIKDHQHVHYHMVPKLVDVQDVRKTRMVMQFMVDNNVRKTTEGDRFIVQGEMDRN